MWEIYFDLALHRALDIARQHEQIRVQMRRQGSRDTASWDETNRRGRQKARIIVLGVLLDLQLGPDFLFTQMQVGM